MKALKIIGIIIVLFIVGVIVVNFAVGSRYDVSRSIDVDAPANVVYNQFADLKNWKKWSPWNEMDPEMEIIYSDKTTGEGAWYSWDGEIAKQGKLTIMATEENVSLDSEIDFGEMGKSDSYWRIDEVDGKTKVTWGLTGEMPWMMSFMNIMMDKSIGQDFEKGLAKIKTIAEAEAQTEIENAKNMSIEEAMVSAMPYYSIRETLTFDQMQDSNTYASKFGELGAFIGQENMANMLGNPFVIFHTWDEENQTSDAEFCFPNSAELNETDKVKKGMSHEGMVLKAVKKGDYNTKNEHEALYEYAEKNGYEMVGAPWEVYGDPATQGVYVEVFYPVMK